MKKLRKFSCSFRSVNESDPESREFVYVDLWAYSKGDAEAKIAGFKASQESYVGWEELPTSNKVFLTWDFVWQVFHGLNRGATDRPFRFREIPRRVWFKIESAICRIPYFKRARENRCHKIADRLFARTPVMGGVIISHHG